ncbi:50S ribosomal protein L21 [Candidatus Spongiihabitans sp.]|uniref:50S ribosomal protein L21 n=1 Tax=Candidatus Spongiihabitans sp. TaxID=3101308 RepID=UPI003C6F5E79
MYAVIETGGKQYKVAIGDKLKVEKLAVAEGDSVSLGRVLMIADGDKVTVGSPVLESPVIATVVSHGRAGKIKVFKMKRRKNYRRTQGHRQSFTEIEITGIGGAGGAGLSRASTSEKKTTAVKTAAENTKTAGNKTTTGDNMGDDLTRIKGIGSVIEKKLLAMKITTFKQIAEFDQAKIDQINEQLSLKGRIEREKWVQQANKLAI